MEDETMCLRFFINFGLHSESPERSFWRLWDTCCKCVVVLHPERTSYVAGSGGDVRACQGLRVDVATCVAVDELLSIPCACMLGLHALNLQLQSGACVTVTHVLLSAVLAWGGGNKYLFYTYNYITFI